MRALKRFCDFFNLCWHDWEVVHYEYASYIAKEIEYQNHVTEYFLEDQICLKCGKKRFEIEKFRKKLITRKKLIELRMKEILEKETMPIYRKKPVEIEAIQYEGTKNSFDKIWDWMNNGPVNVNQGYEGSEDNPGNFGIRTLEGIIKAAPGDWIIKGVKGEFYPCKPDIFELTYEVVE